MRIVVVHLTRMHGGSICVAGIDLETGCHIRPVLAQGSVPFYLLARYGGPFEMARVVDLGAVRHAPDAPHVEDHVFVPSRLKVERSVCSHEFWNLLNGQIRPRLREIFGDALRVVGRARWGTGLGKGTASLGCLRPAHRPKLYLKKGHDGKPQVRMKLSDGAVEADASVTDLRLYRDDHATPEAERIRGVAKWICDSEDVILGLGLTRKFRPTERHEYVHYLQVNNVHLKEDPVWQLR